MIKTIRSQILFSRAQRLVQQGKLNEAIKVFDQALSMSPNWSAIYLHKALVLSDNQEYHDSVTTLMSAIQLYPSNSVYYMFIGRVHYDNQRLDEALQAFEKSLHMDRRNVLTLCFRNLTLLAMGKTEDAYEALKRQVNLTNSDFQSRLLVLCESFLWQKNELSKPLEVSIQDEDTVVDKEPWRIYQGLEDVFHKTGQLLIQAECYILSVLYRVRYAFDTKKKSAYLHYLEGNKRSLLGDFEASVDEYRKALSLFPEFGKTKEQLAEIYFENGYYKCALEYLMQTEEYRKALDVSPQKENKPEKLHITKDGGSTNRSLCLVLGIIYYKLGEYDKAIEKLTTATELGLTDYLPFYYLGLCSIAQNDTAGARSSFKKTTEKVNPNIAQKRLYEMMRICRSGEIR